MLAIRMQRVGRSGHAQFRMIVQDRRFHPTSGRVVAYLGSYNPHTKAVTINKERIESYLANGAQPSPRVVKLLKNENVKLPEWVAEPAKKDKVTRNPDKRRSTRPPEAAKPEVAAAETATSVEETSTTEEQPTETESAPAEEPEKTETPAEESAEEVSSEPEAEPAEPEQPAAGSESEESKAE